MSLVDEVIANAKDFETEEYLDEMKILLKDAEEAQKSTVKYLSSHYVELSNVFSNTKSMGKKVHSCTDRLSELSTRIDKEILTSVKGSVGEIGKVATRLKELNKELGLSTKLLCIHTNLSEAISSHLDGQFVKTAESLQTVKEVLASLQDEAGNEIEIISAVRDALSLHSAKLKSTLSEVWTECIRWGQDEWTEEGDSRVLMVTRDVPCGDNMGEAMCALHSTGELGRRIQSFAKAFMDSILKPILRGDGCIDVNTKVNKAVEIRVVCDSKQDASCAKVLHRIAEVLVVLHELLFDLTIDAPEGRVTLMQMLGAEMKEELLQRILQEVLIKGLPSNRQQLQKYEDQVKIYTNEFHSRLLAIGFCSAEDACLLEYATNVETVFNTKSCSKILAKAREMMLRPLHVTTSVEEALSPNKRKSDSKGPSEGNQLLSNQTFHLPQCQISVSVCDITDLLYETMDEACRSSPQYGAHLLCTVRNIASLYLRVVPNAHQQTIFTIPQHAALVHNNAMYLAHHLLFLGSQYQHRLPGDSSAFTTSDLAHDLRIEAGNLFLRALRNHRDSLMETLQGATCGSTLGWDLSAALVLEKGARQCLDQLKRLQNVWQDVLPSSVYYKSMGTLVNSIIEDIAARVLTLQDISADSAVALSNLIVLVQQRTQTLFQIESDKNENVVHVDKYVTLWNKLSELKVVLESNLRILLDRWDNGEGPLAKNLSSAEAKQLIRALFQNTEKRAKVLAAIK